MPPDLLDGLVIEMPGVAKEVLSNLVCVLEALEGIVEQPTLPEVHPERLAVIVDLLEPHVVARSRVIGNMLLELDNVRVRDDFRVV